MKGDFYEDILAIRAAVSKHMKNNAINDLKKIIIIQYFENLWFWIHC